MDRHWNTNDQTIKSVMKCQKQSLDCYDMIKQSFEESTERSATMTSSKSAGRRSSMVLRNGHLKIGEIMLLILSYKTMYCYRQGLPRTSTTLGTRLNSIIRNGLIPGGKRLKRGRQAVFFTTVNPMEDGNGMGENSTRHDESKDRTMQEYLETLRKYVFRCNLKLAKEIGLQF